MKRDAHVPPDRSLIDEAAHACLIAKDAASNLSEFLSNRSRMALLAIQECERELDRLEREIDEKIPSAITRAGEAKARDLLASLRFITDLERIGDLLLWVAQRAAASSLGEPDTTVLTGMVDEIRTMLDAIHRGFIARDVEIAQSVIRLDAHLDQARTALFEQHLRGTRRTSKNQSVDVLFIAQALERVGDHATNLAEEIIHLVERRSIRHLKGKPLDV